LGFGLLALKISIFSRREPPFSACSGTAAAPEALTWIIETAYCRFEDAIQACLGRGRRHA
jgi:hypothetical protein